MDFGLEAFARHHLFLQAVVLDGERGLLRDAADDLDAARAEAQPGGARGLLDHQRAEEVVLDRERDGHQQGVFARGNGTRLIACTERSRSIRVRREVEPGLGRGIRLQRPRDGAVGFAGGVQQEEFARGEGALEGRFVGLVKSVGLRGEVAVTLGVVKVKHGAMHTDEDGQDADDGVEDFVKVVQADDGLRHLQEGGGGVGLFLRLVVETRIFDGDRGVTGESGEHVPGFMPVTAGGVMRQRDDAQRLVADAQGRGNGRGARVEMRRNARRPKRVAGLADDRLGGQERGQHGRGGFGIFTAGAFEFVEIAVRTGGQVNIPVAQQPDGGNINRQGVTEFRQDGLQGLVEADVIGEQACHFAQAVGHAAAPLLGAIQVGVVDGGRDDIGHGFEDQPVVFGEGVGAVGLDVEQADHFLIKDQRHTQLGADVFRRQGRGAVTRLLRHVVG